MSSVTKIQDNFIDLIKNFPNDWELSKNKYVFLKISNGKNMSDTTDVLSLTIKGIKIKEDLTFGKTSKSYIGHQLVKIGDLVFTPRDFDQTPILSDVSKHDGCISNLYIVDKPNNEFLPEYINYFWHGLKYSFDYFKNFSYGMRHSFNRQQFDEIPILKPSLNEQKIICTYLDVNLKHIDSLADKIHRKIDLLKEQQTSLINQCVTKGLDPNVEMKDSGVEWIGEIPKHWNVQRISTLYSQTSIRGFSEEQNLSVFRDFGVVRRDDYENKNVLSEDLSNYKLVNKGDLVLNKMKTWMGSLGVSEYRGIVSPAYYVLEPNFEFFSGYLHHLLRSKIYIDQYASASKGIRPGQWDLSFEKFKSIKVLLPPVDEQKEIYHILTQKLELNSQLIDLESKKVEILNEYKQSIISSYITGKLRVSEEIR